jgi:glycerol-3-phosphate dehydrogenase
VLNARDAERAGRADHDPDQGLSAERAGDHWQVDDEGSDHGGQTEVTAARALVNAGGPWVEDRSSAATLRINSSEGVRLVRGSHIVTKKLFDHDKCYFFQGEDGRIIFAIPYEQDFTLIGTTDQDHKLPPPEAAVCTEEEQDYLCAFASPLFRKPVTREDIVWTYSGVRPLYDDGAKSATAATRDYVLKLDETEPARRC